MSSSTILAYESQNLGNNFHLGRYFVGYIVKPVYNGHSQKDQKLVFKTNYCLMQDKSNAGEHYVILSTFIKPPFVINNFVLSIFEWPFLTSFTVRSEI